MFSLTSSSIIPGETRDELRLKGSLKRRHYRWSPSPGNRGTSGITVETLHYIHKWAVAGAPTCPLCDGGVPVVKGAAEHGVLAGLQHDVTAHEPPHRAAAVSQQASERQNTWAVEGDPKHQHTQIQQVALCCVPSPDDTGGETLSLYFKSVWNHLIYSHSGFLTCTQFSLDVTTWDYFTTISGFADERSIRPVKHLFSFQC